MPNQLRSLSKSGKLTEKKKEESTKKQRQSKQYLVDFKEAQERIKEAEVEMSRAASIGEREIQVCVLRRGIHFDKEFDIKQLPKFLGTIGKTVYDHFVSREFKVQFRYWMDEMRIGELEEEAGYEVIVSW